MWESPVNIFEIHEPIIEEINNQTEEIVFKAIHRVGVDVNKEELIKAMQYDRNQYEKGYKDAIDEFASELENHSIYADIGKGSEVKMEWVSPVTRIKEIAEQMKGGYNNV